MIALAVMVAAAAIAGWLSIADASREVRVYVRFACVLYAALAVASMGGAPLQLSVTLIVCACAPTCLAVAVRFAFRGPVAASAIAFVLGTACVAGMVAAGTGIAVLAFAPLVGSVLSMIAMSLRRIADLRAQVIQAIAAACALLAGASAFAAGGVRAEPALFLFSAAGLLGAALALAPRSRNVVEQERVSGLSTLAIRAPR